MRYDFKSLKKITTSAKTSYCISEDFPPLTSHEYVEGFRIFNESITVPELLGNNSVLICPFRKDNDHETMTFKTLWPQICGTNFNQNELNASRHIFLKLNDFVGTYKQIYWKTAVIFPGTLSLSSHFSVQQHGIMHRNKHSSNTKLNSENKYKDTFLLWQLWFSEKTKMFLSYIFNNR